MNNYEKIKNMTLDEMAEFLDMSPCNHCADIINKLWQDLTELEQEQIRSILRG